jgi:glutathione S-transferase
MAEDVLELIQFPYSHYNEKVRWTLAHKAVPHRVRSLLPGPHAPTVLRLTKQTQTPVVRFGDAVVAGSARIIDEIERRFPARPLYPAADADRRRALELQTWLDADVGPLVRRALFSILVRHPAYVCEMFAGSRGGVTRALYRGLFPITRLVMSQSMGIRGTTSIEAGFIGTQAAFDRIARDTSARGFLVGDRFSVADLTAAALLAPAVELTHPAMALPTPMPAAVQDWYARWATHPGAAWVREQYRQHRPADG